MPYYTEYYANGVVQSSFRNLASPSANADGSCVVGSSRITTHRSRRREAYHVVEVSDLKADPYAHFLASTSKRKYSARLRERGLPDQAMPDNGHSFDLVKHVYSAPRVSASDLAGNRVISGPMGLTSTSAKIVPDETKLPVVNLQAYAQSAYSRVAPSSVEFDAAQFLGELREGLPSLIPDVLKKTSASFLKRGSSDYLALEFGWKPFISDLQNMGRALAGATQQFAKQGEPVHRRHEIPAQLTSTTNRYPSVGMSVLGGRYMGLLPSSGPIWNDNVGQTARNVATCAVDELITTSNRRWFEGSFSSFLPLGFDPSDYLSKLDVLVNTKITPETLWNLSPWSWLVDWQLRIGDSISANMAAANDLLIMHYGYAMEHTTYNVMCSFAKTSDSGSYMASRGMPSKGVVFSGLSRKRRIRAHPYGFQVASGSSLTAGQWSILSALGLQKGR